MSIQFQNVTKSFGVKRVLDQVSFDVKPGEILFILGKSGVGKSVTLKHIVGMLHPDEGQISVDGKSVSQMTSKELDQHRTVCGMVFQHPALFDSMSVFENIAFGLRRMKPQPDSAAIHSRVIEVLQLVHLSQEILNQMPSELSYGMQKRVSLARTLAPLPRYLLFDEPTTGLDPITTQAINDLIFELSRKLQITSVVVSHDMRCALQIADQILVLDQARILAKGSVAEMKVCKEPLIQDFLRESLEPSSSEEKRPS